MKKLREMKEMREELKQIKDGIDEVIKEQERMLRENAEREDEGCEKSI